MSADLTMRIRTVLVYAANGVQGSAIARQLHSEGFVVRAVVRDAIKAASLTATGISTFTASLDDPASLRAASQGMDAVVLTLPLVWERETVLRWTANVALAARESGARLVVYNVGTRLPSSVSDVASFELRRETEQLLRDLAPPTIMLRPPLFMENLAAPHVAGAITEHGVVPYPLVPTIAVSWLCVADLGAYIGAALRRPELAGKTFEIGGPQALDGSALARELSSARAEPLRYLHLAPHEVEQALAPLLGAEVARGIARNYVWFAERPHLQLLAGTSDELSRDLKRPPTSVATWARTQTWAKQT